MRPKRSVPTQRAVPTGLRDRRVQAVQGDRRAQALPQQPRTPQMVQVAVGEQDERDVGGAHRFAIERCQDPTRHARIARVDHDHALADEEVGIEEAESCELHGDHARSGPIARHPSTGYGLTVGQYTVTVAMQRIEAPQREDSLVTHLLVPMEASQTTATVWLAVVGEAPGQLTLEVDAVRPIAVPDDWTPFATWGQVRVRGQRIAIDGLAPGRRHTLRLLEGTHTRASATTSTLPDTLPSLAERPFTCLLGSCFGRISDGAGAVGAAVSRLPAQVRPDATFLVGDQVYLDAPFARFLKSILSGEELRAELLETYLATWTQDGPGAGFAQVLRHGATFFSSDDHELWNNAPSRSPAVINSWFAGPREEFRSLATALYDHFQGPRRSARLDIGRLSVLVEDTRMDRASDRSTLMPEQRMRELRRWLEGLAGPGILVLGQPVLSARAGWRGHFLDWALPDFRQYDELVRALQGSRHDIVVLTGDVHYGRVAGCRLPSGAQLVEVIASPFALVDARLGHDWHGPPGRFPDCAIPGTSASTVWVDERYREARDHFATVGFSDAGNTVRMDVQAWPIGSPSLPPRPGSVYSTDLH